MNACLVFAFVFLFSTLSFADVTTNACIAPSSRPALRTTLESPDGRLRVMNEGLEGEGTYQHSRTTFEWIDDDQTVRWVRDSGEDTQGWVESLNTFRVGTESVYVVISELKAATTTYVLQLDAYRIKPGATELQPAVGFFPVIPGVTPDRASISWEYSRMRGSVTFPRPVEARFRSAGDGICFWVTSQRDSRTEQENILLPFSLHLREGRMRATGLQRKVKKVLGAFSNEPSQKE